MKLLLSLVIFITSFFEMNNSFENGLWRGTTLIYQKGLNNKLDFNNIYYNYNITKFSIKNKRTNYLNLRFKSSDNIGGIITNIPKIQNWNIDNNISYISEINFFQDTKRSLIVFNFFSNFKGDSR